LRGEPVQERGDQPGMIKVEGVSLQLCKPRMDQDRPL
jgi:hypothetical protein